jgi:predicted phosphodiesterase
MVRINTFMGSRIAASFSAVCLFTTGIFAAGIFAASCDVDLSGLLASGDTGTRLADADKFVFLKETGGAQNNYTRNITTGDDYTFIVIGDTHIKNKNAHGLEKLSGKFLPSDKFIVVCGDITQSGQREEVERFIEIAETWRGLGLAVLPVIGNHDTYFGNWRNWKELIGSTRYRVDSENTTLIVLDNANGFWGDSQLNYLETELTSAKKWTFVFMHVNPFSSTGLMELQQVSDVRERARFANAVKKRVQYVFSGHIHKRVIMEFPGTT